MILVVDNYDSFTYNLAQYIGEYDTNFKVIRNDEYSVDDIEKMDIDRIIISPGPGRPADAGVSVDLIKSMYKEVPILGVCLGHQAIGEAFGARINYAKRIMHGKVSDIHHTHHDLFNGLTNPFPATRYHSLIIDKARFPKRDLEVIATLERGMIMGVQHVDYPVFGIQFHPESILTENGKLIIRNFLNILPK